MMMEKVVIEKSYQKVKNQKQAVEKVKVSKKQQKEDQGKKEKQVNLKNNGNPKNIKNDGYKVPKQNQSTNLFRQFGQYAAVINQLSERGSLNFDPNSLNHHIFL